MLSPSLSPVQLSQERGLPVGWKDLLHTNANRLGSRCLNVTRLPGDRLVVPQCSRFVDETFDPRHLKPSDGLGRLTSA